MIQPRVVCPGCGKEHTRAAEEFGLGGWLFEFAAHGFWCAGCYPHEKYDGLGRRRRVYYEGAVLPSRTPDDLGCKVPPLWIPEGVPMLAGKGHYFSPWQRVSNQGLPAISPGITWAAYCRYCLEVICLMHGDWVQVPEGLHTESCADIVRRRIARMQRENKEGNIGADRILV